MIHNGPKRISYLPISLNIYEPMVLNALELYINRHNINLHNNNNNNDSHSFCSMIRT